MTTQWPHSIREPVYRLDAPRQTVSLTINSDLYTKAKAEGVNVSRVAEDALAQALDRLRRAHLETEVRGALDAVAAFEQEHGSFPEQMREQFGDPWVPGK